MNTVRRSSWPLTTCATLLVCGASVPLVASGGAGGAQAAQAAPPEPDQRDLGDVVARLLGRDDDSEPGDADNDVGETRFVVFPTVGGNPAIGLAVGALASLTNYWGDPAATKLSSMLVSAAFTTQSQVLVAARSDLYTPDDGWHLVGDWRYYKFTERTYGLGSGRPRAPVADVEYDWYRLYETVYRPVWGALEIGVGYHLDIHTDIALSDEQRDEIPLESDATSATSTTSSGISLNVVYDQRDHPLNPERGLFGRARYTFHRTALGSDSNWERLKVEGRAYQRLPGARRQVLAAWALGWFTRSGDAPYFDLPSVGWDTYGRTARGYAAGRFRGRDWIYGELEYRADLTRSGLLGMVAFVNSSWFSDFETTGLQQWAPAGGTGLRIKLDKDRRSNIAIDIAWGREGSKGIYLAINEAF